VLNVAPQKERIPDHLRAMAEQDDKSAASGKTGEQSSIGVGCAPGEERDSAISICAVHSATVTAAIAEYCEDTVEKQKTLTEVLDGLVDLTTRLASLATARRSAIVAGVVITRAVTKLRCAAVGLLGLRASVARSSATSRPSPSRPCASRMSLRSICLQQSGLP